jgi:putative multiple sugar transport system substrate-binding protein
MKKIIALLLSLCLVFSLAACGKKSEDTSGNAKDDSKVDVGIVLPTKDEPRWLQDQARFEDVISSTDY